MKHTCDICCPTGLFGKPVAMKEALDTLKDLESPHLSPLEREWFDRLGQGVKRCPCGVGIGSDTAMWSGNYPTEWIREHYQHCSITYPPLPEGTERWQIQGIDTPVNLQPQWLRDYLQHKNMKHPKLLPCPFCGDDEPYESDVTMEDVTYWSICCQNDCGQTNGYTERLLAYNTWNNRADMNNKNAFPPDCGNTDKLETLANVKIKPLLSILFFVTGDMVFGETETMLLTSPVSETHPFHDLIMSGNYVWTYTSFDQIKADIEAFTAELGARETPKLPYITGNKDLGWSLHFEGLQGNGNTYIGPRAMDAFKTLIGFDLPVYKPQQHEAVWTCLYPLSKALIGSFQSDSFSVWRCEIVVK